MRETQWMPPKHTEVDYHDPTHRYHYNGVTYTSATQLLDRFKEKFDTEERSQYMAERYGNDPQYWRDKWDENRDNSLVRGNAIHNAKEVYLYGRGVDKVGETHMEVRNRDLYPKNLPYYLLPDGVYPELKLWRHDHRIAGRSDKIILRTTDSLLEDLPEELRYLREPFRIMDIEDYKTNKAIRKESFYTRNKETGEKEYKMMKGPLSHLMDCEMVHYSLQLSIYQYMGEYHGFVPGNRRVIHYQHEIEGLGVPEPVVHELPYLRNEVIAMLDYCKPH